MLLSGGTIANTGSAALIEGGATGVYVRGGAGTVTNAGTIEGSGFAGVWLISGGTVANTGSAALIEGATGVYVQGTGTVVNYGTIASTNGGDAVKFTSADELIDEAHSTFIGTVVGGGGTLELAGTGGTITGLGSQFVDFGTYRLLAGASWTLTGTGRSGAPFEVEGTLDNLGTLDNSGGIAITGNGDLINGTSGSGTHHIVGVIEGATGVQLGDGATVTNAGTIIGTSGYGIDLTDGGRIVNQRGGVIDGAVTGIRITGGHGFVINGAW